MSDDCETEIEQMKYRVESEAGRSCGFSGTPDGAKQMAAEADDLAPDDAPHQVRRVPESEVHGQVGRHPVIYNTEDGMPMPKQSSESDGEIPHDEIISLSAGDVRTIADGEIVGPWIINGERRYVELDSWETDKIEVVENGE